jgi:hypothetical protein
LQRHETFAAGSDQKLRQAQLRETQSRAQHEQLRREIEMVRTQMQHYVSDSQNQKIEN